MQDFSPAYGFLTYSICVWIYDSRMHPVETPYEQLGKSTNRPRNVSSCASHVNEDRLVHKVQTVTHHPASHVYWAANHAYNPFADKRISQGHSKDRGTLYCSPRTTNLPCAEQRVQESAFAAALASGHCHNSIIASRRRQLLR